MGKQRSKILRGKAEQLLEFYPDKFSVDFEVNKKALDSMDLHLTKITRNIIAGYMVTLVSNRDKG